MTEVSETGVVNQVVSGTPEQALNLSNYSDHQRALWHEVAPCFRNKFRRAVAEHCRSGNLLDQAALLAAAEKVDGVVHVRPADKDQTAVIVYAQTALGAVWFCMNPRRMAKSILAYDSEARIALSEV